MHRLPRMEVSKDGRALPPRPSLLVGDAQACQAAWSSLEPKCLGLLHSLPQDRTASELDLMEQAMEALKKGGHTHLLATVAGSESFNSNLAAHRHTVQQLHSQLPALRSLRESLVSNEMLATPLARQVYERTVDVAAAGGRPAAPELLKGLQGLISDIYPSLADPGPRAAQMYAAYLLFFAVAPARPSRGELVQLMKSPGLQDLHHHPVLAWTMKVLAALAVGDWVHILKLRAELPSCCDTYPVQDAASGTSVTSEQQGHTTAAHGARLLRELLDFQLGKVRQFGLTACAATYRTLPWRIACSLLGLVPVACIDYGPTPADQHHDNPSQGARNSWSCLRLTNPSDHGSSATQQQHNNQGRTGTEDDVCQDATVLAGLCSVLMNCVSAGNRGASVAWHELLRQADCVGDQATGSGLLNELTFKQ